MPRLAIAVRQGAVHGHSEPWFGHHRGLRGGSFARRARLPGCRCGNSVTPERGDVFAGLRSASS